MEGNLMKVVVHTTSKALVGIFQMLVSSTMAWKLIMTFLDMIKGKHIIILTGMVHIALDIIPKVTRRSIKERHLLLGSTDMVLQDSHFQTQLEMIGEIIDLEAVIQIGLPPSMQIQLVSIRSTLQAFSEATIVILDILLHKHIKAFMSLAKLIHIIIIRDIP
uniref:Uncharacterized protein n=1 Tax=Arundo donax TaxID=35708 RepID=A0A0A9CVN7_ARUDO